MPKKRKKRKPLADILVNKARKAWEFRPYAEELLKLRRLADRFGQQLELKQDHLDRIGPDDVLLFATLRNEAHRMEYFLRYYRELGVSHFIFVDNGSDDGFSELVASSEDVSVFYTIASYKASNFGMHWLNYLLRKYGTGHWCLTCDPDEFLVYPHQETLDLPEFCRHLEAGHHRALFTLMIDMYGRGELRDCVYRPGTDPLTSHPYFDAQGYVFSENPTYGSLWSQGGVRMRTLFKKDPGSAPALNKTPLVRWKSFYAYVSSMHMLLPRRLNRGYRSAVTGALLHFKFIAAFEDKIVEELERGEHYNDSKEYEMYRDFLRGSQHYEEGISVRYRGWRQLKKLGLLVNKEII